MPTLKSRLHVALVGCGRVVEIAHIPAYQQCRDLMLPIAVVDPSSERRERVGMKLGIPNEGIHATIHDLFNRQLPDAIVVACPPSTRGEIISAAADVGCAIICEKPLCVGVRHAQRICDQIGKSSSHFAILHNYLHRGGWRKIIEIVQGGAVGIPDSFVVTEMSPGPWPTADEGEPSWRITAEGGGPLWENLYHTFYLSETFLGPIERPVAISPQTRRHGTNAYLTSAAVLHHQSGGLTSALCSWSHGGAGYSRAILSGSEGVVIYDPWSVPNRIELSSPHGSTEILIEALSAEQDWGYVGAFRQIFTALLNDEAPSPGLTEAVRLTRLIDAAVSGSPREDTAKDVD
jgi:predicted dehydrogenase